MSDERNTRGLIQQHVEHARAAMVQDARERLTRTTNPGQDDRDHHSNHAVYAAAKAYCEVYESVEEANDWDAVNERDAI